MFILFIPKLKESANKQQNWRMWTSFPIPLAGIAANKAAARRQRRKAQKTQELVNQTLTRHLGKYPPLTFLQNLQGNSAFLKSLLWDSQEFS